MPPEMVNPKSLYHREEDPAGSDFRRTRHVEDKEVVIKHNGAAKTLMTVGGFAISLLLALTAFFAGRDRMRVDNDIIRIDAVVIKTTERVASLEEQVAVLKSRQERVLSDLTEIRAGLKENGDKLDKVLIEIRKAR